jgi:O-acetyl-ADP-ribose deacetylase (regulator of RNase III)
MFTINFPTEKHWRARSRLSDIRAGLMDLRLVIRDQQIKSIAIPPLGCGNGGLDWRDVRPLIVEALGDLPDVQVMVYFAQGCTASRVDEGRHRASEDHAGPGRLSDAAGSVRPHKPA